MTTNEKDIRYIDISGGILRQATCAPTDRSAVVESVSISNTNKCLRTISVDAKFFMCDDDIEDNLTGAQLESQVLRMAADQIANEAEFWSLMANANGSYSTDAATSPVEVNDAVLHLREGWYRQLQHGNIVDAASVDGGNTTLSFNKLNCLKTAIPTKHRQNPAAHRIYMPSDMLERDFATLHQGRETTLGDTHHTGPIEARHLLTPITPVPLMPTDVTHGGCGSLPDGNGAFMFQTEPSNMILGIQRQITFERERWATDKLTWFIWTFRWDVLIFNEDATALVDSMTLTSCGDPCGPAPLADTCNQCLEIGSGGEPA
ncbi:MAG: hypothetical protein OES13_00435 [Acidimicrobiia bacterium]|nr:hypothetical protein [Acidimicrobiia bacterium]